MRFGGHDVSRNPNSPPAGRGGAKNLLITAKIGEDWDRGA
jgi:hypothetical protein